MTAVVKRTVCLIEPKDDPRLGEEGLSLSDFEFDHSYVLLGEPGMGKTTEFNEEADRVRANPPIPARQFISRNLEHHSEWKKGPLFIDGLDEVRIGSRDPRIALNKIIERLETLGNPQFRLSCRSINWLGSGDWKELATLSDSRTVLQLNPLNYNDIREIISEQEANAFIRQAHEHNMEAFLGNPQLLTVLLKSVENGGWSDSPTETFKNACRELIREQNHEHRDARSSETLPSPEAVLSAAGQLSAFMLIANKSGWSAHDTQDSDILTLQDVESQAQDPSALRAAFNSGLFQGNPDCRTSIHRLFAEFLSGRYLDEKIRNGLSVRRVFALLMGHDGIPFPDLRGLAAWLAAFNPQARTTLIHADPVAVAFNGDAGSFGHGERRELLKHLEHSINLNYIWPSAAALGALAGHQDTSPVWELADSSERSSNRQNLVYNLLQGVSQKYSDANIDGENPPGIPSETGRKNLLNIIYDSSWDLSVRREALRALNRMLTGNPNRATILRKLLMDLKENRLRDKKNDLRSDLLDILYPSELQPSEIWDYLVNGATIHGYNSYLKFWDDLLVHKSQKNQIRELLDSLCGRVSEVTPKLAKHRLADIILDLLARGLNLFGDELSIPDLYRWFKMIEFDVSTSQLIPIHSLDRGYYWSDNKANEGIHNWLNNREAIQLALIEHELIERESIPETEQRKHLIALKFVGKDAPAGFRSWCLARAVEICNSHPKAAEHLALCSIREQEGWEKPLSDEEMAQAVSSIPSLREWNRKRIRKRIREREQFEAEKAKWEKEQEKSVKPFLKKKQEELEHIRQQKTKLAAGNCSPALLHDLATIYFDGFAAEFEDPKSHLESYLDGDASLVKAALAGFRSLLNRDDLPDLDQITQLYQNSQISYFAFPFLAGIEEENGNVLDRLSEKGRRRAIGFYLVTDIPRRRDLNNVFILSENDLPSWYKQSLTLYPEAVADSLVLVHNACVRAKYPPGQHLFKMAFDETYAQVAPLAVSRMFPVFPTRCNERQLESLRVVLWSAILAHGMSTEELQTIVLKRLHRKNMDIAQRAQWLCAGVHVARDRCLPLLVEFLSEGHESRIRRVLGFLVPDGRSFILQDVDDWSSEEMSQLIRVLGKRVQRPDFRDGPHFLSKKEINRNKFQSLLTPWIQKLAERSDDDAVNVLTSLVTDPNLTAWKPEIARAQEEQGRRLRAAKRPDLNLEKIQKALRGGPPANAADLTALTTDVLEDLADRIRNGATNDWRQYWHRDQTTGKPIKPQHEDDCRDALLSDLTEIFKKYRIDAQPEGRYADDKRADIRVSFESDLAIPIEIKKNHHRDIWRGVSEQLVSNYTRDPKADGFGIYLVFWFGIRYMKVIAPKGCVPNEPEELKSLLKEQLGLPLREKIHIVVIDVSPKGRYAD